MNWKLFLAGIVSGFLTALVLFGVVQRFVTAVAESLARLIP